jgi:AAA ATPase domain
VIEAGEPTIRRKPGILERDAELSVFADAVHAAAAGDGSVVLVFGEAGIGKSSLVAAVHAQLPAEGRIFVGYCDDLATPRTLGPFRDLVGSVGAELSRAVTDGGDRDLLLGALRAELTGRSIRPSWSSRTCTGRTTRRLTRCVTSSGGLLACPPSSSSPTETCSTELSLWRSRSHR